MITVRHLKAEALQELEPAQVDELNRELQWYFGRVALEVQRHRGQKRLHVPAEEARVGEGELGQRLIIAPELGFDIYAFHVFVDGMAPRTEQGRYQTDGDTVKYYLSGSGYELIGGQRLEVRAGDFMHIPANTLHGMQNPNDEPLRFLAWQQIPGTFRQTPTPSIHGDPSPDVPSARDLTDEQLQRLNPKELHQVYLKAQMEWGQVLQEVQRRRGQKRLHVPAEKAPLMEWGPGQAHMIIGPEYGFDIYTFHIFLVVAPPGGRAAEERGHFHGDAVKYYISGHGYELIGDQRFEVKAGDFMHIPAYIWHLTVNGSQEEPLRYLAAQQFPGTYRLVSTPWQWTGRRERESASV